MIFDNSLNGVDDFGLTLSYIPPCLLRASESLYPMLETKLEPGLIPDTFFLFGSFSWAVVLLPIVEYLTDPG